MSLSKPLKIWWKVIGKMPISEKDTAIGQLACLGETGKETIGKNPSGSGQTSNTNLGNYPFKKSEFFWIHP